MKSKLKEIEDKMKEQINQLNRQMKRQKWMNVYLLWSR